MNADLDQARALFIEALGQVPPDQWEAFLAARCGDDAELHHHVHKLLQVHVEAGSFLDRPAIAAEDTGEQQPQAGEDRATHADYRAEPGALIGPYKLLEPIGEGGMGAVWMAQQTEPVKRLVAIKLIKAGMDSKQVIVRFEAERQALALMDHPNIARVLDGGTTGAGRPYFVMDLVKGVPITTYCDEHHLTPRQRLELFLPVCQAVQHAHHKGVIHRDLKPSNVLVALYDGKPVPRVIDFGVAKAAGQPLTDKTLVTAFGAIVGTLEYMSPEQAEINQLDIDTRSDIYSLGVLLYELLTGSTPFTLRELEKGGGMLEMLRVIREQEPTRPSAKLSTAEGLPTLAANRGMEPGRLAAQVRGELDWIVMKALEKDRSRRYETANGFAMDVQRYLNDEPVLACPPSAGYRFRKFARRNKAALAIVAVITLAVLTAVTALAASNLRISREKNEKELARHQAALNARRAREAVNKYFTEVSEDPELKSQGLETVRRKLLELARDYFVQFVEDARNDPELRLELAASHTRLGLIIEQLGQKEQAIKEYEEALGLCRQLAAAEPNNGEVEQWLAICHGSLGRLHHAVGRLRDAEAENLEAIAIFKRLADATADAETRHLLAVTYNVLGVVYMDTSRPREAEAAYQQAIAIGQQLLRDHPKHPRYQAPLAATQSNLGFLFETAHRFPEAERAHRTALELRRELVRDHRAVANYQADLAASLLNLGSLYDATGRPGEAEKAYDEARAIRQRLADLYPNVVMHRHYLAASLNNLANVYSDTGRPEKAAAADQQAHAIRQELVTAHGDVLEFVIELGGSQCNLGNRAKAAGKFAEALEWYDQSVSTLEGALRHEARHPTARQYLRNAQYERANALNKLGRHAEAVVPFREALRLDPDHAESHCNLGHTLNKLEQFREGLAELRRGHELGSKRPGWDNPSADWVRDGEILLRLDEELAALQRGEPPPADVQERIGLAEFCVMHKQLHLTGLRLWEEAFAEKPELADHDNGPHLANAACAAALAGSGQGRDVARLDDRERARLRQQALNWLRPALARWTVRVNQGTSAERAAIQKSLREWQTDSDMACVRDEAALAKLPEAEREAWRKFWADLAALLARADALNKDRAKPVPPKKT
jgi:serine/threonine protein kinase/Flp pilus assembly protein TadD